jgi:hypothetical protein
LILPGSSCCKSETERSGDDGGTTKEGRDDEKELRQDKWAFPPAIEGKVLILK